MTASVILRASNSDVGLEFFWQGDRYHHQVVSGDRVLARSVEGDSTDAWPSSPPIQQLSLEQIQDQTCVLGVGAAGRGHWSISVRLIESEAVPAFEFDLACRSKETPERLVSTYDVCERSAVFEAAQETEQLQNATGLTELRPHLKASQLTHQWKYRVVVS